MQKKEIYLILDNVRSILNVGSIFRTADAAGVTKVYLCGYTPTPDQHAERIGKTALGAEKMVPWEHHANAARLIDNLKKKGIKVLALERSDKSKNIFSARGGSAFGGKLALVVGNEVKGLSKAILKRCRAVLEIPMHGQKESLNVSVAAGIALYQLLK